VLLCCPMHRATAGSTFPLERQRALLYALALGIVYLVAYQHGAASVVATRSAQRLPAEGVLHLCVGQLLSSSHELYQPILWCLNGTTGDTDMRRHARVMAHTKSRAPGKLAVKDMAMTGNNFAWSAREAGGAVEHQLTAGEHRFAQVQVQHADGLPQARGVRSPAGMQLSARVPQSHVASVASNAEKKVIAYSLYGSNPKYVLGAERNAELIKSVFPGWIARFYLDASTVPERTQMRLRELGAELVPIDMEKRECCVLDFMQYDCSWRAPTVKGPASMGIDGSAAPQGVYGIRKAPLRM